MEGYLDEQEESDMASYLGKQRWAREGSNLRPRDYESPALTTELRAHGASTAR